MCLLVISHPLSMGRLEFVCKRSEGPRRMLGFHEQLVFCICMKSPSLLFNYVSVAASISMATPLHHHLKLNGATPRTGNSLFWVTPLRHTTICVHTGVLGWYSSQYIILVSNILLHFISLLNHTVYKHTSELE